MLNLDNVFFKFDLLMKGFRFNSDHANQIPSGTGYAYSTGIELVFKGLGSTSTTLKNRIEKNIPNYQGILR